MSLIPMDVEETAPQNGRDETTLQAELERVTDALQEVQEEIKVLARERAGLKDDPKRRRELQALDRQLEAKRARREALQDERLTLQRELSGPAEHRLVAAQVREAQQREATVASQHRAARVAVRSLSVLLVAVVTVVALGGIIWLVSSPFLATNSDTVAGQSRIQAEPDRPELSGLEGRLIRMYLDYNRTIIETPPSDDQTPVIFEVASGESATEIGARLEAEKLIRDAALFRWLLRYRQADTSLEAGTFELTRAMSMDEVIEALQSGRLEELAVTIPEGWRAEEVARLLEEQGLFSAAEYLALVLNADRFRADFDFLSDLPAGASLEGYLFPDTYRVIKDQTTAESFLRLQLTTFGQRLTLELRQQAAAREMTIFEAVTLASVVEREAVVGEERPLIAGVYINRWEDGTILNADPTVQYAVGQQSDGSWWKRPLSLADLQIDSPYNTYIYPGLPPGPIASAGSASLEATITAPPTNFYYFVARGDNSGTHVFAETLEEHNANVAREQGP